MSRYILFVHSLWLRRTAWVYVVFWSQCVRVFESTVAESFMWCPGPQFRLSLKCKLKYRELLDTSLKLRVIPARIPYETQDIIGGGYSASDRTITLVNFRKLKLMQASMLLVVIEKNQHLLWLKLYCSCVSILYPQT